MSRIGKQPIPLPDKVEVAVDGDRVRVKGPLGELSGTLPSVVKLERQDKTVVLVANAKDPSVRALYGMARARLANMVHGVHTGFSKTLDIVGLGFKVEPDGASKLTLSLGYSHKVHFDLPKGVSAEIDKKQTSVVLKCIDKDLLGQTAARFRELREPEPYKGTGIRYHGERIIRKAGKTAAGAGAGGAGGKK
ncbi:MAG: 50S ribosomal protein L6 [Elusimicrobiota bacterium]|jgi:large subunit ribosomal protein L6